MVDMINLTQKKYEVPGSCEHAEQYGNIKCMECLVQLSNYQLLKKGSVQWV
jgi:hypothetical protein